MKDRCRDPGIGNGAAQGGEDGALGAGVAGERPCCCHGTAPDPEVFAPGFASSAERADPESA
eukprot:3798833-Heterocapsa_arctica.AAC.1